MDIQKQQSRAAELPTNPFGKQKKSGSGGIQQSSSYNRAKDVAFKTTGKKQFKTDGYQAPRIISKTKAVHTNSVPGLNLARTIDDNSRESLQMEFPEENSDLVINYENQLRLRGVSLDNRLASKTIKDEFERKKYGR